MTIPKIGTPRVTTKFTHKQRLEACGHLYETGSSIKAARACSFPISPRTLRMWNEKDPDFQDNFKQLVADNTKESQAKFRVIIQKGLDEIIDRISNGNVETVSTGELLMVDGEPVIENGKKVMETTMYRTPMSSKDLTYTTGIIIDKHNVSLGQATHITKKLTDETSLMDQFTDIYNKYGAAGIIESVATDVTPKKVN